MNTREAEKLSPQQKTDLEWQINQWYRKETRKGGALLSTLLKAPVYDDVRLIVTTFNNVLSPTDDKTRAAKGTVPLTEYEVEINGEIYPEARKSIYQVLDFATGVPKVVKLTIEDGEDRVAVKGKKAKKTLNHYIPVGVVFLPKNGKKNVLASVASRDFKQVEGYCFGNDLFFVFSPTFDYKDLTRYAVIIQRLEDGQVGIIDPGVKAEC
jgi:hypothetical protein